MSVIFRNLQAPLFIKVESNILSKTRDILQKQHLRFERPLIISEKIILELGGNEVLQGFEEEAIYICSENSLAEADKIIKEVQEKNNDLIIAVGGCRILDVGKYAATKAKMNYVSIPTSPSTDGIASPVAVLKNEKGVTESLSVNMPMGILVDLELMKKAPVKNIQAGTADLISNFSALEDWKLAQEEKGEQMDDFAASLAYSSADLLYGNVNEIDIDLTSTKFLKTLVNGLIISGIAMNIAGSSRPCSGAEHKISHAIDKLFPGTAMHGQQVALGTILAEKLRGGDDYENYKKLFKNLDLPTSYKDLGLTEEQMIQVIKFAPKTRPGRYSILEKLSLSKEQIKQHINES